MRCGKIQEQLDAAFDSGQPLVSKVEAHLANCQECQKHRRSRQRLQQRLAALPLPAALPADFAAKVVARLRTELPAAPSPWEAFLFAARRFVMGAACALALASVFAIWTSRTPPSADDR